MLWMFIFHLEYILSCKNFCKDDKKNILFLKIFRFFYVQQNFNSIKYLTRNKISSKSPFNLKDLPYYKHTYITYSHNQLSLKETPFSEYIVLLKF